MPEQIFEENAFSNKKVSEVFHSFPEPVRQKLFNLRELIFKTAGSNDEVGILEETLKWGEPSYTAKGGSSVRLAWKDAKPDQFGIYFHCQTKLVDTFRALYGDLFSFEGNRAILFNISDTIPKTELQHCILLALTYHKRKHLPLLGA